MYLYEVSGARWGEPDAQALQAVAHRSAASGRAVRARSVVIGTMAHHLLAVQQRLADLETAIAEALADDDAGQRLQSLPGVGPIIAATMRAE